MNKILVVDDDDLVRSMLQMFLEDAGYEVEVAGDGNEALAVLQGGGFRLVITDIVMPDKEGLETIREARKALPDLQIIAISGGGRSGAEYYLDTASKFGAAYAFCKPVDDRELLAAVRDLMGETSPVD